MSPEIMRRINQGDSLSDAEVLDALDHFKALSGLLSLMGPPWSLMSTASFQEESRLKSYAQARGLI